MSATIDEKVVEMRFENKQFESNVSNSISTLSKLKQSLNLTGATKGLEDIDSAAKQVDMGGLGNAVETVRAKFSALQVMGITALTNITNQAVNAGKKLISAITIDPIKSGFQEYETQMNAVQTILANTESKGTTLNDVNTALDTLNAYADKTIYNFTEMTRNIGTFTAAGVDLETSVNSIQGIANLAAVSGSNAQQASTAMYQLSQALSSGTVKLQDWNSVVNAGMGGQVFQDALKRTAKNMGVDVDAMIEKYGSFRETLSKESWLTADVLNETLNQFTMAAEEGSKEWNAFKKTLTDKGYTEEQAVEILKMANTATDAATKVKTFTQLIDTLKESLQSGWTQVWETIIGDFGEAKELFTEISDTLGAIIGESAESRIELVKGWKDLGGRTDLIDSLKNAFEAVTTAIKPITEAFQEIFPPATSKQLYNLTAGLKSFTEKLIMSSETADKVKRTFKGLFSIVDIFKKIITSVAKAIGSLFGSGGVTGLADLILSITASIGDFFTSLNSGFKTDGFTGALSGIASTISKVIGKASEGLKGFGKVLSWLGKSLSTAFEYIWDKVSSVFTWISENISAGDIFAGLTGGGILLTAKKIGGLFDKVEEVIDKLFGEDGATSGLKDIADKFGEALDSLKDSLTAFTTGIKVWSLVGIAAAIALLTSSLRTISGLEVGDIAKSLGAIGIMFGMLTGTFKVLTKSLSEFPAKGVVKAGIAMIVMAKAVDILADAIAEIGELSLKEIIKGLIGVGGGLIALIAGLKAMNGVKVPMSTAVTILALAKACDILGDALQKFGSMSWDEIKHGLTAMGLALAEFVVTLSLLNKFSGSGSLAGSISMLIAVQSLDELSENLKKFGSMAWGEIGRGLAAMGGALAELGVALGVLGKVAGFSGLLGAATMLVGVQALDELSENLKKFGSMSWGEIGRGLTSMGLALTELGVVFGALGMVASFSGIIGAATILIGVQALDEISENLKIFGSMSWSEIGRGLTAMGIALVELGVVFGALGMLTGVSGILGAVTILVGVQGLDEIANALQKFGSMSWSEIGRGLTAMGLALTELGVVFGLLGVLAGPAGILGAGTILIGVQGLDDLANALLKFGSMSWDEVKTGLAAMGGALGELAVGGLLNTLSIIGAHSISEMAEPLGTLADSIKKWSGVTIPANLGLQLAILANGVYAFTFGGLGASAISTVAEPLGTLADSVKKWTNVTIPAGLVENFATLADGIKEFTFSGIGASALSTAAAPLGTLADSVKKWGTVTVPANIGAQLSSLADGVKSFSWAFMGGWSLSAVAGPLGELADDISKWSSVSIPSNLPTQISGLSSAIESFSGAFMGGWSLSAVAGPLGELADDVKKWNGVKIPQNLPKQLTSLSDGVKSFTWAFAGGWSIDSVSGPLGSLANSVKKWNGVVIPEGIGKKLSSIATGIKSFSGIGDISSATKSFGSIAGSASKLGNIKFDYISKGLVSLGKSLTTFSSSASSLSGIGNSIVNNIVTPLQKASSQLSGTGGNLINSLSKGMSSKSSNVSSTITNIISKMISTFNGKKGQFQSAGVMLLTQLASGITKTSSKVTSAIGSIMRSAVSAARSYYSSFESAGRSVASGFAAGISANSYMAAARARAMASTAASAARQALDINSPSKVFRAIGYSVPEGFAMGIDRMGKLVTKASYGMTDRAVDTVSRSISRIADVVNNNIDAQPTIRPVLDLSNVRSGANSINGLLSGRTTLTVGTRSVNSIANTMSNHQNGSNSGDIVSAIKGLRKDISNMPRNSYTFGDITYDDGSNVADAVKTLVRAARVERRV